MLAKRSVTSTVLLQALVWLGRMPESFLTSPPTVARAARRGLRAGASAVTQDSAGKGTAHRRQRPRNGADCHAQLRCSTYPFTQWQRRIAPLCLSSEAALEQEIDRRPNGQR